MAHCLARTDAYNRGEQECVPLSIDPMQTDPRDPRAGGSPPAVNVPAAVLALIAVLALAHYLRADALGDLDSVWYLFNLGFFPGCYGAVDELCALREPWADIASPVTHAFLHGDWMHLVTNTVWLLAFGSPVARRLGTPRFLVFCAVGALAGAGFFYLLNRDLVQPMIGASGVVSALMGGAARFALGTLGGRAGTDVARAPLMSVARSLSDRTVVFFVAVFFGTNLVLGSGSALFGDGVATIAWEAHVGGFLFGFLAFAPFDPRHQRPVGL